MDREDRIKRFAQMQGKEEKSSDPVQDILRKKKEERRKRQRRKRLKKNIGFLLIAVCGILFCCAVFKRWEGPERGSAAAQDRDTSPVKITESAEETEKYQFIYEANAEAQGFYGNTVISTAGNVSVDISKLSLPDWVEARYLTVNPYSRPGQVMDSIQYIAIHYVGNAGTTANQNWSYFEGLKDSQVTKASSHFVVGIDGEVISCIPLNEMSYCTNERNVDTISIEVCHPDAAGQFTNATYQSVVKLTAWLCNTFSLPVDNVIRHYDVTGKVCPKYYVEHEDAWEQLKADIEAAME